ncbi:hypothetical protein J6590_000216 [Homalodisca vitripennis]|nr:hypothetical protein J6590_000216 [Homalodisca vitripennis]
MLPIRAEDLHDPPSPYGPSSPLPPTPQECAFGQQPDASLLRHWPLSKLAAPPRRLKNSFQLRQPVKRSRQRSIWECDDRSDVPIGFYLLGLNCFLEKEF